VLKRRETFTFMSREVVWTLFRSLVGRSIGGVKEKSFHRWERKERRENLSLGVRVGSLYTQGEK